MTRPRYLTERTSPHSYGPRIAQVSKVLGRPLMPWQELAAGLIGECDQTGTLLHPVVVITVPRQSGKTALLAAVMLHRLTMRPQARVWYTAQTGMHARAQMNEMQDAIDLSKLGPLVHSKRGAADTSLELLGTGSRAKAHPPLANSLHGMQSDLNVIDEAWEFSEIDAHGLMGAITPTQATRPNAQTIIVSTAGTAESIWFHELVDKGYSGDVALIDYGVDTDVDVDDFEGIANAHPAIGHTQTSQVLIDARPQLSAGEFMRAYGNRRTTAHERLIPVELVELATVTTDLPDGPPVFGCAVSFDRDDAIICAATRTADDTPVIEIIETFPSTDGVAARLADLSKRHNAIVAVAPAGPAAPIADDAERLGAQLMRVPDADLASATADFLDRIRRPSTTPGSPPGVLLRSHPAYVAAFDAAALRTSGDRVFWSRRHSAGSISAVEAATLAAHATNQPAPIAPMIWT